ncbi:ABC-2 family transporter protein [Bacteriovorax sp. Seq25_V]|nr:ABC-2 family transporter protein [Bacteriovorax sp. Seq25_V]
MINVLWVSLGVLTLTYVTSEFSYGNVSKVALDFGLSLSALATSFIAIFVGASLLSSEIENRTAYITLSRPVTRQSFILGKILGTSFFLLLNSLIISAVSLLCFLGVGGEINLAIFWAVLFSLLEAIILLLVVLNFSLITNRVISVINTLAVFILGHAIPSALKMGFVKSRPELETLLNTSTYFIPNLDKLNIKNEIVLSGLLESSVLINGAGYALFYILFLIILSILIFNKKELN